MNINRQPAGQPTGGQFAEVARAGAGVSLSEHQGQVQAACQSLSSEAGFNVQPGTRMNEIALQGERYEIPGQDIDRPDIHAVNIESDHDTGTIKVEVWAEPEEGEAYDFTLSRPAKNIRVEPLLAGSSRMTVSGLIDAINREHPHT